MSMLEATWIFEYFIRMPKVAHLASQEEEEETEQVDDNLEKCNIIELKDKLRAMNLPVSGRKAELIQRIRNAKWYLQKVGIPDLHQGER